MLLLYSSVYNITPVSVVLLLLPSLCKYTAEKDNKKLSFIYQQSCPFILYQSDL